jgi:hypothetical protein
VTCRHCGIQIGEQAHSGKSYGFIHKPEDGPDAYVWCKCQHDSAPCCCGEQAEPTEQIA